MDVLPRKKGVDGPGRVWPLVGWWSRGRIFHGAPGGLVAQGECAGTRPSAQRSRPVRHDPGCGVRRGGQRRVRTLGKCTASMQAGDLALHFAWDGRCTANFDDTLLTLRGAERPAFSHRLDAWGGEVGRRQPRERTIVAWMCSQRVRYGVPAECQRSNAGEWSGDPVQSCPGTDQRFFIQEPGRVLRPCSLLWCSVIACNPVVSGGIGLWLHHSPGKAVRQRAKN